MAVAWTLSVSATLPSLPLVVPPMLSGAKRSIRLLPTEEPVEMVALPGPITLYERMRCPCAWSSRITTRSTVLLAGSSRGYLV